MFLIQMINLQERTWQLSCHWFYWISAQNLPIKETHFN